MRNWADKPVYLQVTSGEQSIVDIGLTVKANKEIIPSILAAHVTSGCNTVAPYHGVGKVSIVKKLRMVKELKLLGYTEACIDEVVNETAALISSCYGFETNSMTDCRINSWYQKTSKARKSAALLQILPPSHGAFRENVKYAHFQMATWYSTMNSHPPNLDPAFYGWVFDEINKILCPVDIPEGISPAPPEVLNLLKCNCSSNKPCSSKRCACDSLKVACSVMCQCRGDLMKKQTC